MEALHECIQTCFQPLGNRAIAGVQCETSDKNLKAHILLASYVADIPEPEDLLSMKRGSQTAFPCHGSPVKKGQLPQFTKERRRTLQETKSLINRYCRTVNKKCFSDVTQLSFHPVMPMISTFPFLSIHSSVDIYSLFDFDPMNVLSFGVSWLLKKCLFAMLGDAERTTSAINTKSGSFRSLKSIKCFVLQSLNRLLRKVFCASPGIGPYFGFSHSHPLSRNNGLFCEQGLTGMLQSRDMDSVDKASSFLGAMVDAYCGVHNADTTPSYNSYTYMVRYFLSEI